ncbi:hypothetical protein KA005_84265 [bacterium]|nr:hypothetical protein [bacterium]
MQQRIPITGSSGLIGASLYAAIKISVSQVARLDLRASGNKCGVIHDSEILCKQLTNCTGIVHLAAVSHQANSKSIIRTAILRSYDVSGFFGNPEQIHQLLNWQPRVSLRDGVDDLIREYRREAIKSMNEASS